MDTTYTWKNRILDNFKAHVNKFLQEDAVFESLQCNPNVLKTFFESKYIEENVRGIFNFSHKAVDWKKTTAAGKNFLADTYMYLCVEIRLYLGGEQPVEKIREFWDLLGKEETVASSWKAKVTPNDFAVANRKWSAKDTTNSLKKVKTLKDHPRVSELSILPFPMETGPIDDSPSPTNDRHPPGNHILQTRHSTPFGSRS